MKAHRRDVAARRNARGTTSRPKGGRKDPGGDGEAELKSEKSSELIGTLTVTSNHRQAPPIGSRRGRKARGEDSDWSACWAAGVVVGVGGLVVMKSVRRRQQVVVVFATGDCPKACRAAEGQSRPTSQRFPCATS